MPTFPPSVACNLGWRAAPVLTQLSRRHDALVGYMKESPDGFVQEANAVWHRNKSRMAKSMVGDVSSCTRCVHRPVCFRFLFASSVACQAWHMLRLLPQSSPCPHSVLLLANRTIEFRLQYLQKRTGACTLHDPCHCTPAWIMHLIEHCAPLASMAWQ